ncbi:MAG: ABC transporter permease [Ruminococcus sp.]|nr:ABC transporter permease [Ruminococcus sp.]
MKGIKRCQYITSLFILLFIILMIVLTVKIRTEARFYMSNSDRQALGMVYDRNGGVLFDGNEDNWYEDNYFIDVGNLIGDNKGQMTNTLVSRNLEKLSNYSFNFGAVNDGKSAIYTTLDHNVNRAVYNSYGFQKGCAVAYNYVTGEILVCTSLPSLDVTNGYDNIEFFESGTLISKNMYCTVPGSTQKISTVISALEILGKDTLFSKVYSCSGHYTNQNGDTIDCHNWSGHGEQGIQQAVENSCNPFFAQLIENSELEINEIIKKYRKLGYAVNDDDMEYIDIDGILCEKASTTLVDKHEFRTEWGCIGQGDTMVSPIQLMMWQSAIANGTGRMTMPHLIDHVTDVSGEITETAETKFSKQIFSAETASTVKQIMLTNGANHYMYSIGSYPLGVKSGTAQVEDGEKENSLLVGFLDDPAKPIAFCILVEDKNSGFATTEQIAKTIIDSIVL